MALLLLHSTAHPAGSQNLFGSLPPSPASQKRTILIFQQQTLPLRQRALGKGTAEPTPAPQGGGSSAEAPQGERGPAARPGPQRGAAADARAGGQQRRLP